MSRRRSGSVVRTRTYSNASSSIDGGPPSPTFSSTTAASQVNLNAGPDTIITRRDLRQSVNAYEDLVSDCQAYRAALSAMSSASSRFAATLERCSRLKGVEDDAAIGLQAAGGLHHLMANHWQVLDMTLSNGFEQPLQTELTQYKKTVNERSAAYERLLVEKSKIIKKTEAESINTGRRKQRDLQSFRKTLAALQAHVDDLDRLKAAHYLEILEHEAQVWNNVLDKTALAVRSSLDVFERLSAKASDPMLEPLMQSILDPFDAYASKSESEIFSILPPLAIMQNPRSSIFAPSPSPHVINGYATTGNNSVATSPFHPAPIMTSQSWAETSSSDWSNQKAPPSPSSSRRARSPSSPPSTSTLRKSGTIKARPTVAAVHDVLSTGTIRATATTAVTDTNAESFRDPSNGYKREGSRRDTVLTLRPSRPEQQVDVDLDSDSDSAPEAETATTEVGNGQEVWLAPPHNGTQNGKQSGSGKGSDNGSIVAPTPKRSTFASSIHKLMSGGNSGNSSGGEKSK